MALNPNELFYRGYNPATLLAGYEDTWAMRSWKEVPQTKTGPAKENKEEKSGIAALYSGHYNENLVKARKGPMARNTSLQEKRVGVNGTWFLPRRPFVSRTASLQERKQEMAELEKKGIVELRMPLCCEGCVEKVQRKMKSLKGVASVECSQEKQKVIVRGSASAEDVLQRAKAALPRSTFWVEEN